MRWLPIEQADKSNVGVLLTEGQIYSPCRFFGSRWRTYEGVIVPHPTHFLEITPPTDDASAAQDESVVTDAQIEIAVGGMYELPDRPAFWIDKPVALEIVRRVRSALRAAQTKETGK